MRGTTIAATRAPVDKPLVPLEPESALNDVELVGADVVLANFTGNQDLIVASSNESGVGPFAAINDLTMSGVVYAAAFGSY